MKLFKSLMFFFVGSVTLSSCLNLKEAPTKEAIKQDNTALENMSIPNDWVFKEMDSTQKMEMDWVKEWETENIDTLIREAYKYNADVQIASSRIEQANLGLRLAESRMKPQVGIGASAAYLPAQNAAGPSYGIVNASWEMDLWGKLRYGNKAAETMIYSAEYAQKKLKQVLAASIARAYYTSVYITEQKKLIKEAIETTESMSEFNQVRLKVGMAKESDVLQMDAQIAKYKETLVILDQVEQDTKRAIELLMGRYPKGELAVEEELMMLSSNIPAELPLSMLENRPEIMISQYAVAQAFYSKEVAEASRWPSVKLNTSFGGVNQALQNMWHLSNPILTVGAGLTTPIFTGGAIKTNIAIQNEQQKQAVLYYAKSYLNALSEVETSLNGVAAVEGRFEQSNVALEKLQRTYELSEKQYQVGNENMFTLLQKQLQLIDESTNQLNLKYEKISQRINLYMALGGDYL
ncbi:TolC family protein [Flammeovirga sp. MY04]|uniref:TolC family protein n=1 Tax=Flammeovirga sp. MY04 TaxID=1191459 RepID=UPI000825FD0D|nr:TolC family protein [Flammeovirga sp. MY04]ANQ50930.2 TolC family protein [Flammeovirga sp. MY04]